MDLDVLADVVRSTLRIEALGEPDAQLGSRHGENAGTPGLRPVELQVVPRASAQIRAGIDVLVHRQSDNAGMVKLACLL